MSLELVLLLIYFIQGRFPAVYFVWAQRRWFLWVPVCSVRVRRIFMRHPISRDM